MEPCVHLLHYSNDHTPAFSDREMNDLGERLKLIANRGKQGRAPYSLDFGPYAPRLNVPWNSLRVSGGSCRDSVSRFWRALGVGVEDVPLAYLAVGWLVITHHVYYHKGTV